MPCYSPLKGYRAREAGKTGKYKTVFNPKYGYVDIKREVPCGQCIGCKLERSRQWAIRCSHEASLYDKNCFITLTYDNANLPPHGSLDLKHFQKFMKRLRKRFGANIRFFHCGEYGETCPIHGVKRCPSCGPLHRPHYHACLFNFDLPDREIYKIKNKQKYYTSEVLNELWPVGFSIVGDVTFESAAYVARYITKKITGDAAASHYRVIDPETGEIFRELLPEYTTMSRRPGIGTAWLKKYHTDVYPDDFVVMRNRKMKPPKFYDRCYEIEHQADYSTLRSQRIRNAKKHSENNTPERLKVREKVQIAKITFLKREIEEN